ncbi:MAG TPA: 50S ribosomal protein L21 [Spirochaetota bacterium]|nr:50S ribosomal protein L21 [Spirochaetota bacterium]HOM39228.1 50S ribosomal protein L21 [Spirochaetota bacterium]HPP04213.1 50S ribosomal protein L21 [Spirochaetota bacterium]
MKAIFEDRGFQYTVQEGDTIAVALMEKNPDEIVEFNNVLLLQNDDDKVEIGTPYVKNAKVTAKVIENKKDKKILVFKFKRRKNEKRLKGHRQKYTIVKIESITA